MKDTQSHELVKKLWIFGECLDLAAIEFHLIDWLSDYSNEAKTNPLIRAPWFTMSLKHGALEKISHHTYYRVWTRWAYLANMNFEFVITILKFFAFQRLQIIRFSHMWVAKMLKEFATSTTFRSLRWKENIFFSFLWRFMGWQAVNNRSPIVWCVCDSIRAVLKEDHY